MKNIKFFALLTLVFCYSCTSEITFDTQEPEAPDGEISDLIISEITTFINTDGNAGGTRNHYVELYNGTNLELDLSNYAIGYQASMDEKSIVAWDFSDSNNVLLLSGKLESTKAYVIASPQADASYVTSDVIWGTTSTSNSNASIPLQLSGNSAIALLKKDNEGTFTIEGSKYKIIDVFGSPEEERVVSTGSSSSRNNFMWPTAGESADTRNRTFWRKATVIKPTSDWNESRGTTGTNAQWTLSLDREWDYSNVGKFTGQ